MKIRLIDNWRDALRMYSVRVALLLGLLGALQAALPMFQQFIPPFWFSVLTTVLSLIVVAARIVYQPELHPEGGNGQ